MATDWAMKEKEAADKVIDAFISWTNADDEAFITIGRENCCLIRNEIERLRRVEKLAQKLASEEMLRASW